MAEGKWRKWLRCCRAALSVRSPGFLCASINGWGRSNYCTNEAGKEICQPSGIELNTAEKYWILQQTWKIRGGCVSAHRRGQRRPFQWVEIVWMLHIKLSSLSGTQPPVDQGVKGATLLFKVEEMKNQSTLCSHALWHGCEAVFRLYIL